LSKKSHIYYLEVPKNSAKGHEQLIAKKHNPLPKNVTLLTPKKTFNSFGLKYFAYTQAQTIKYFLKYNDKFDIFITYNTYDIALLNLARLYNKKIIFMYVDEYEELTPNRFFKNIIAKNVKSFLKKADIVVCTAKILEKKASLYNDNVYYLPNAVKLSDFSSLRKDSKGKKKFIVGFVGALGSWVDVDMIVDAAKMLGDDPRFEFRIIGSGASEQRLKSRISDERIKNIKMLGFMNRNVVLKKMLQFDIAIIPFKINKITHSVSPVKLFEYWMTGNPVIATKTFEMSQYKDHLLLVDDAEGLKDSIIRLSNDENLGKKLSSSGRKLVIEKYNWEKYQAIYGKIIDSLDRR